MEWNLMEPGGSGAGGLGCFVEDTYVPADECEEVLDDIIESLTREDPKLRNGRRKLACEKIVEKDLVPLIMFCIDEEIIRRCLRLLANLTQPLEVFLQLGLSLGQQCQREINLLVGGAKARCTDLDFFKSLHSQMKAALTRVGDDKVQRCDSELLNHALLLMRNLLHTSPDDRQASETSITLQSMLSSFFLSEMDKLLLRMLNHQHKSDWVVSIVQLLSLVFKDHAGILLEEDEYDDNFHSDCKSDCDDSGSDVIELAPTFPTTSSKLLSHNFDKQLHLGGGRDEAIMMMTSDDPCISPSGHTGSDADLKDNTAQNTPNPLDPHSHSQQEKSSGEDSGHLPLFREEKDMQTNEDDEEEEKEEDDDVFRQNDDDNDDERNSSSEGKQCGGSSLFSVDDKRKDDENMMNKTPGGDHNEGRQQAHSGDRQQEEFMSLSDLSNSEDKNRSSGKSTLALERVGNIISFMNQTQLEQNNDNDDGDDDDEDDDNDDEGKSERRESTDTDSGRADSREDVASGSGDNKSSSTSGGERTPPSTADTDDDNDDDDDDGGREEREEEEDSGVGDGVEVRGDCGAEMVWETGARSAREDKEREILSELSSGSCLMDNDIIISYLRKFATDIVCSGLSNLVQCLMKALMSSYEGVLDDSFFMWTVGFFLSYARHSHIEFTQYRDLLNLDVFGFLVYQGYRNCDTLACQMQKQENCSLIKYRLHLVVCTLNQLFQVILSHCKESTTHDDDYIGNVQKCLAQMLDLQRMFVMLIRQSPCQDVVYLRDLIHTNHTFLLLLEEWVSRSYLPLQFSMLSHVKQYATTGVMEKYASLLEQYSHNNESLNVAILTMMYHIAGDCNKGQVLLQLPILKKFSEIWGDITCSKYAEFNDLIEFVLESFMTMAFKDPVKCAQQLFHIIDTEEVPEIGLTEEEQDLLFTWTTDLQGSLSMVDDLVRRLHNQGSSATRQHVMLYLLRNGWLEEKQMEALSDEIKELQEKSDTADKNPLTTELSGLEQEELIPFLVGKIEGAGHKPQLKWLQEQMLEAAYIKLGLADSDHRVHVEEPLARFYALQDKSIPVVAVNEEECAVIGDAAFSALLQALGLFPSDPGPSCVLCRIPHFLSPSQLVRKAQQLGDIDINMVKFDLTQVKDDLSFSEFSPLFKDDNSARVNQNKMSAPSLRAGQEHQGHQWLRFVCHVNQTNDVPAKLT